MLFSYFENVLDAYTSHSRQIVLAFSGGVDSRVLLDLLSIYRDAHPQHRYLVIHIHHGLSDDADYWMKQCEVWVHDAGFCFQGLRVQVAQHGKNIEKSAREARYRALADNVDVGELIITGQHADDQVETFLLALKRGSGPAGLAAMPLLRLLGHANLLRPLLSVTRAEIELYANSKGLHWVEDKSNLNCRFDRNFIRQSWLPAAKERWPGLIKAVNRTAKLCAEQEALLEELLAEHSKKVNIGLGILSLTALATYSNRMQSALVRRWLKKVSGLSASQAQLQELFASVITASYDANPKLQLGEWQVRRFQQRLYLVPVFNDILMWKEVMTIGTVMRLPDGAGELCLVRNTKAKCCSNIELNVYYSLSLREPAKGETISVGFNPKGLTLHPSERQKKRKLKKLYQEYGVPSWLRRRTPLIYYGNHLAAVADLFVCKGFEGKTYDLVWHKNKYRVR
ncbi:tRNA lysidine(34) synthetase TilS [Candidatus Enterovibrio altilux]|uniref:tRNA(Ile)-lysidine synthase n=1 Tax=Candidatus Enterovibrio altilux TaxID=1927128 RepID=A0A291B6Q9_9GAMM|nr:tRNA lysidine(34) synthetase TilS [Candidatus Enterovibrio luxaltus]ATF08681.1 tRNA(Ile)-lysidine synthetase [Candidatus Enterovibrio luxaltus]